MLRIEGAVAQPLSLSIDDLRARYTAYSIDTRYANEVRVAQAAYTGARLWDILQSAKVVMSPAPTRPRVLAEGADGFRCVVEWHEFDPAGENKLILVAYLQNGQPIQSKYGPLRLVVPGDSQGLRYIGNLTGLTMLTQEGMDF